MECLLFGFVCSVMGIVVHVAVAKWRYISIKKNIFHNDYYETVYLELFDFFLNLKPLLQEKLKYIESILPEMGANNNFSIEQLELYENYKYLKESIEYMDSLCKVLAKKESFENLKHALSRPYCIEKPPFV